MAANNISLFRRKNRDGNKKGRRLEGQNKWEGKIDH